MHYNGCTTQGLEVLGQETVRWSYLDSMRALVGWSVSEHIGEINISTLVVAADEDYSPVSVKEAYVAEMPNAELVVIPDSRRATPVEQPKAFNRVVAVFLARQG